MMIPWKIVAAVAVVAVVLVGVFLPLMDNKEDDTLLVAISSDVKNWYNKQFADGDARFVWAQVYGTLVRLDTDLVLEPGLAESWQLLGDGTTWEFKLREGVKFHDGSDFDAAAVTFSYGDDTFVKDFGVLKPVQQVVQGEDPLTVRFIMKEGESMGSLPYYLTHIAWPVMSPNMADESGEWNGKVIGTGPFRYVSDSPQEIVLERFEDYHGEASALKGVKFKVLPDPTARKNALKAGDVDMILKVSENDVAELQGSSGVSVHIKQTTFTDFLQFNAKEAGSPFADVKVRQAVARLIDTEAIVENLLMGHGQAAKGRAISPVMHYVKDDLGLIDHDPVAAATLMGEAGWVKGVDGFYYKDGVKFSTTLILSSEDVWAARFSEMASYIADKLKEAGMEVQVDELPAGAFNQRETDEDFGMLMRSGYFVWGPYPRHFLLHTMHPNSHYSDMAYNGLVRNADAATDPEVIRARYHDLQEWVIDELPAFYMVHEVKIVAHSSAVRGYSISAEDPWLNLEGVSVVR